MVPRIWKTKQTLVVVWIQAHYMPVIKLCLGAREDQMRGREIFQKTVSIFPVLKSVYTQLNLPSGRTPEGKTTSKRGYTLSYGEQSVWGCKCLFMIKQLWHPLWIEFRPFAEQKCPVRADCCPSFCHHSLSQLDSALGMPGYTYTSVPQYPCIPVGHLPFWMALVFLLLHLFVFASLLAELLLLKAVGEDLFHAFLLASGVGSGPWHSLARRCLNPLSASNFTWPSLCGSVPQFLFL